MKGKGLKRFLGTFLSCVLALSTMTFAPMTVNAEGGDGDVFLTCEGFWSAHSQGYAITEEAQTYVFHSKTNEGQTGNHHSPFYVVFHSENGAIGGGGYKEYGVIRSDNYYWDGAGMVAPISKATEAFPDGFDWAAWQESNRAGADCTVTTQLYNGSALIGVSNNGVTTTYVVPVDSSVTNYLSFSGEQCVLSNFQTGGQPIDLTKAKEIVDSETEEPDPDKPGTEEPDPEEPETDVFLDCPDWWVAHTEGMEITEEPHTYKFHSKTYDGASDNWLTPIYVVFHSEDKKVDGTGYKEYGVIRSDDYYWDEQGPRDESKITQATTVIPDWAAWLAENIKGVDCTVTTQLYNGNALIGVSNGGATATYVIPVDSSVKNYLSLTGQSCTLSNLQTSEQHIELSAAKASVDASVEDPGTEEPGTEEPGGVFLDCNEFWSAHYPGFEITATPQTYTFHTQTDAGHFGNYETPLFIAFHSDDGKVNGEGYREYGVIRSDNFYWDAPGDIVGPITLASTVYPAGFDADWEASWPAWQAANRAGVDCSVTTQLYKGYALIAVSNNGITTTYAVPVDTTVKNYLSLSGEFCTLSNLQTSDKHLDLSAAKASADNPVSSNNNSSAPAAPAAPASEVRAVEGGEVLVGSAWWTGMAIGSNQPMSGDGTWTWVIQASALADGYGAFSVEIYDPATNGYITTGSDMNAWTAEGFNPASAVVSGVPAELASNLVEGHTYVVTVNRSGNTFMIQYVDYTEGTVICTLSVTPGEPVSNDVMVHVMAQVGTYSTSFVEGALTDLPASKARAAVGEVLTGTAWWTGMTTGSNKPMSGDGTWTWTVKASSLMDGYGAFSVEIYDPATNGYITTGSDMNAWTAEGFDPAKATVSGVPANLASNLVEGHTYAVTVTRSGNTFTVRYSDHTTGKEICTLVITPGETVGKDVLIHVMAQVGTFATAFNAGTLIAALGDSAPIALYVLIVIGLGAIGFGFKKRFAR